MRRSTRRVVPVFVAVMSMGVLCMAQDVELPLTWKAKGSGTFVSEYGVDDVDLELELSVDEFGEVSGKASTDEGDATIKHFFYTDKKEYEAIPGFFTRKLVIVFMLNENSDRPQLAILNGRVLNDRFLYGEVLFTRYEKGSETARALGVGNAEPTLLESEEMPLSLKSALGKCLPVGMVKLIGDYKKQTAAPAAE